MARCPLGRLVLFGVTSVLLSACSTASLAPPITAFADTMRAAGTSFSAQQTEANNAILEESLVAASSQGVRVQEFPEDCNPDASRCRLFIKYEGQQWPFSKDAIEPGLATLMSAMVSYSQGLAAIADAKSTTEVAAATAATRAVVLSLAGSVDALTSAAPKDGLQARLTPFAGPVTELATAGLRLYLEQKKLNGLREAVSAMEEHIDAATELFVSLVTLNREYKIPPFDDRYRVARAAYRNNIGDRTKLLALRAAAEDYDRMLVSRPDQMFVDMRKAHGALAEALAKKDMSFANLWPLLQEVLEEAAKIAPIVQRIEDAAVVVH